MKANGVIGKTTLGMAAFLACALLLPSGVGANSKVGQPFKIKGAVVMTAVDPVNSPGLFTFTDVGESTYLGRYSNSGWLQFDATGAVLLGGGACTAANGDISNWYEIGSRTYFDGGTGRFDGDSGYFDSTITSGPTPNPDGTLSGTYTGIGTITFAH